MIAENKAKVEEKKQKEDEDQPQKQTTLTENVGENSGSSVKTSEKTKSPVKATADDDAAMGVTGPAMTPGAQQMMSPAEFTLPEVMYFNVGTPENPIFQNPKIPFTQRPNSSDSAMETTVLGTTEKQIPKSSL